MSKGINKVIIIGNLGAAPEVRYTQNSTAIATLSVATTETWKDKQTGEPKEQTEWHRCVAYRRLGEIAGEYLKKGSKVYIEGRLQTRKWQSNDGQDRYTTEIVVSEMQMLDARGLRAHRTSAPASARLSEYDPFCPRTAAEWFRNNNARVGFRQSPVPATQDFDDDTV